MRKNVTCTMVPSTNAVMVWSDERLVGIVSEEGGEPLLMVYGNWDGMRGFTFKDLEIIQDNWNQLQEMRGEEEKRQRIYKKGVDSGGSVVIHFF